MNHGSLFSGIGGFDLAAEWAGWNNVFHCEWNPFGQRVLKYYWPKAISYDDITKTDFTPHRGSIDILSGGFPCQPYSQAGKRLGKEDDRHLWPEMLRAIREIQPGYVVGENVRGLTNWNGGLVFDEVQADLEAEGYEVTPVLLPACAVNAPHRRDRIWFVAYSCSDGHQSRGFGESGCQEIKVLSEGNQRKRIWSNSGGNGNEGNATDTGSEQLQGWTPERNGSDQKEEGTGMDNRVERSGHLGNASYPSSSGRKKQYFSEITARQGYCSRFDNEKWIGFDQFPTQSPVCNGNDGFSSRLDGITFPKWRNESIKAGGNAIVPQVAFEIFKAINKTKPCKTK